MNVRFINLALLLMLAGGLAAQESGQSEEPPVIEPRAQDVLRQMCNYLKQAEQFTFQAEVTVEEVLDSGQKLQFQRTLESFMRRPNKVRANFEGENGSRRFWYDGSKITLLDVDENLFATSEAPATIDEALDFAMASFGVTVPIADLLFSDPYESLMANVQSGLVVGRNTVRDRPCHHLAFSQESIDWQIWIEDGEILVPRKLIITYKKQLGQPQYTAVVTNWNMTPRLPDLLFTADPPDTADEIQFLSTKQ